MKAVHCKIDSFDVYVGRPTKWGNPFDKKNYNNIGAATLRDYMTYLLKNVDLVRDIKIELKGKTLGCWCAKKGGLDFWNDPVVCHAQILGRISNPKD